MALSDFDRDLVRRCLDGDSGAWDTFVERFAGLVTHVVNHTALARAYRLSAHDRDDLIAEVFLAILDNNLGVLRRFRGGCSLATYLAVIARRVAVKQIMKRMGIRPLATIAQPLPDAAASNEAPVEQRVDDRDEVDQMLGGLEEPEARVVRMFHLEGESYHEISRLVGVPENTIGPLLSRVRTRIRRRAGMGGAAG